MKIDDATMTEYIRKLAELSDVARAVAVAAKLVAEALDKMESDLARRR